MPDWFYRTVSRPILFRFPARHARGFALGFMGALARLPLGRYAIDFLGHMAPDARLARRVGGIAFRTPVGLGPALDGRACALPALARFGFGFIEAGPVLLDAPDGKPVERVLGEEALWLPDPPDLLSLARFLPRAKEAARLGVPLMARLGCAAGALPESATGECLKLAEALAPHAPLFSLATLRQGLAWPPEAWQDHVRAVKAAAQKPVWLCVPSDLDVSRLALVEAALKAGCDGLLVDGSVAAKSGGTLAGEPARPASLELVRTLRARLGRDVPLIAAGGVHEPVHALELQQAGADLIELDTGLVFTGPGLPKRVNELLLHEQLRVAQPEPPARPPEMSWFWTLAMGAGMVLGSLLALVFASTIVVLPYDLTFIGMTRDELHALNPRLLQFMAHDRVSLAGTMVATGVMYVGLSAFGIRRGLHWAQMSVFFSAFTGFASFFLFLGFGYLDPFHAFVTAVLFQFLLLGLYARLGKPMPQAPPELRGDWAWKLSLWGQLLLIIHGVGLLGAGAIISTIGVTHVFVPEDLAYMQTTSETLHAAHPRLVPLIAHDRATFGGMLLSSGWVFLLPALWGFRRGASWLWCTYVMAGPVGYVAAIGVHYAVGYTDLTHLLPAFAGLTLFTLGVALSFPYLTAEDKPKP